MAMSLSLKTIMAAAMLGLAGFASAHGNVTPQDVDTGNLPKLGDEVRTANPFREGNEYGEYNAQAIKIGESAYAGNCAACHGIRAMSGGADAGPSGINRMGRRVLHRPGDEWYRPWHAVLEKEHGPERHVGNPNLRGIPAQAGVMSTASSKTNA